MRATHHQMLHSIPRQSPIQRGRQVLLVVAVLIGAGALALTTGNHAPAAPTGKPNIVVIQTDDQTLYDLYATYTADDGSTRAVMPNTLSLLADQGVTFDRYYVSFPLCCPSRAALLTGRYAHDNGILGNDPINGGYENFRARNDSGNVAVWLQDAGYRTIHIGKFMNGYGDEDQTDVPSGWNEWHTEIGDARTFYGYMRNDNGVVTGPHGDDTYVVKDDPGCPTPTDGQPCNYLTDVDTSQAIEQIGKQPTKPFYLQVDYIAPHGDILPPPGPDPAPRHDGSLAGVKAPRVPGFNEADVKDKPGFVRHSPKLTKSMIAKLDYRQEDRLESLRAVDDGIGAIIARLEQTGDLPNTYIFFTSDNGFFQGEHRFDSAKFLAYEPSNHMPFIVRGPGLPAGVRTGELTANIDLAPTFLEISGGTATLPEDGRSIIPFAQNPSLRTRRPILLEGFGASTTEPGFRRSDPGPIAGVSLAATPRDYKGIRVGSYKYILYRNGTKELYDLSVDPYELNSVDADPRYAPVRKYLDQNLGALKSCEGISCQNNLAKIPQPLPRKK